MLAALVCCVIEWHLGYCDPYCSGEYQHTSFVDLKSMQLSDVCTIGIVGGPEEHSIMFRPGHRTES